MPGPTPARYRRKPDTREALQYTVANFHAINEWLTRELGEENFMLGISGGYFTIDIETAEGRKHVPAGYWIVRDSRGLFYPVHPDEFANGYEPTCDPFVADKVRHPVTNRLEKVLARLPEDQPDGEVHRVVRNMTHALGGVW